MSSVANLILHVPYTRFATRTPSGEPGPLSRLQQYLYDKYKSHFASIDTVDILSPKGFEACVWVTAINYLDQQDLLDFFQMLNWESPEYVQLMIKDQHDEYFAVHTAAPKT